jgi:single stranded DNA-binding protein
MRKIMLSGRLAANAEIKMTTTGSRLVEFRIANNEYVGGTVGTETYWFRVVGFLSSNPNLERLVPYLTKGKTVEVMGNLKASPYVRSANNELDPGLEVIADTVMFDDNFSNKSDADNTVGATPTTATVATPTTTAAPKKAAPRNPTTGTVKAAPTPPPAPTTTTDDGADDLPF